MTDPISSPSPQTFEELKIGHGFVLYSTTIKENTSDPVVLSVPHLRDRAQVFVDKVCYFHSFIDWFVGLIKLNYCLIKYFFEINSNIRELWAELKRSIQCL